MPKRIITRVWPTVLRRRDACGADVIAAANNSILNASGVEVVGARIGSDLAVTTMSHKTRYGRPRWPCEPSL